jgi:hypothetical protein
MRNFAFSKFSEGVPARRGGWGSGLVPVSVGVALTAARDLNPTPGFKGSAAGRSGSDDVCSAGTASSSTATIGYKAPAVGDGPSGGAS